MHEHRIQEYCHYNTSHTFWYMLKLHFTTIFCSRQKVYIEMEQKSATIQHIEQGPFIYYVITFLGFLDPPPPLRNHVFRTENNQKLAFSSGYSISCRISRLDRDPLILDGWISIRYFSRGSDQDPVFFSRVGIRSDVFPRIGSDVFSDPDPGYLQPDPQLHL